MTDTKGTTTLDSDTSKPSVTAPGDGPADTTDPSERAVSAAFDPSTPEAQAAGTVNAVKPAPKVKAEPKGKPRIERYDLLNAAGVTVTVERNIETGESKLV